jgi:hypothetical protein
MRRRCSPIFLAISDELASRPSRILDQVDVSIRERQLHVKLGMAGHEFRKQGHDRVLAEEHRCADPEDSDRRFARRHRPLDFTNVFKHTPTSLEEDDALVGEADVTGRAVQERRAEAPFETGDGAAHEALADTEFGSGGGKAARIGHGLEGLHFR